MREHISSVSDTSRWTEAGAVSFVIDSAEGDRLLAENGWSLRGTPLIGAISARAMFIDGFTVLRIEARPTVYHLRSVGTQNGDDQVLVYCVERGSGTIEIDGSCWSFRPGHMIVFSRGSTARFAFEKDTEMTHVRTSWKRFMGPQVRTIPLDRPFVGNEVFVELLNGLHRMVLDSGLLLGDCGLVHIRRSLEAAVDAVFAAETDEQILAGGLREHELYRKAAIIIESTYNSEATTPDSVAATLGVSRKYLEAAFRDVGDTVAKYIRRSRATHAQRLLHDREDGVVLRVKDIARDTGFSNVQSMRRAIKDIERLQLPL